MMVINALAINAEKTQAEIDRFNADLAEIAKQKNLRVKGVSGEACDIEHHEQMYAFKYIMLILIVIKATRAVIFIHAKPKFLIVWKLITVGEGI
ncbi:hypothetical protein VRRI112168_08195 [Vreelandella rituensis]|uniref:Uncharacterized protein n=2 Tax=Vreelandella rituensis TaxID=2282306 RepID=A0A368TW76_9GAMM|nr:hypothetical protein DU506_13470 [Halomonas rituensis]